MAFYRYEAVQTDGKELRGVIDAADEAAARARLSGQGFLSVAISGPPARVSTPARAAVANDRSAPIPEIALFFRQFAQIVKAGITVQRAMDELGPRLGHPALIAAAREIGEAAKNGGATSDVLARRPRLVPSHVAAAVRAGETGGFLEIVLDEIALDYEQQLELTKGMGFARFMVVQSVFAVAIAQPAFPALLYARFTEYLSLVLLRNTPIAAAVVLLTMLWWRWLQQPQNSDRSDRFLGRLPAFRDLARQRSLAAFVRMLRRLYMAGLSPADCWEGAMQVAPSVVVREQLAAAHEMMKAGKPIHEAFAACGLFANQMEQMLTTGVLTGDVPDALEHITSYYQDTMAQAAARARFWMYRIAFCTSIAIGGLVVILFAKSYFDAVLSYTAGWAD